MICGIGSDLLTSPRLKYLASAVARYDSNRYVVNFALENAILHDLMHAADNFLFVPCLFYAFLFLFFSVVLDAVFVPTPRSCYRILL